MNTQNDIDYVKSVLAGKVASCVLDGELMPPDGAKCKTRAGFRAWLRREELKQKTINSLGLNAEWAKNHLIVI
jgi:hypothetical protein